MTVRIHLAETTEDLDALFRLRHRIFVEEKGWFPPQPDGRVADRFDAYPTTANVIAVIDGRVVGGIRFVAAGPPGMPTDRYLDFSPFLPPDARAFSGSMLCVEPDRRNIRRLVSAMIGMGYYWGLTRGLTHLVGATNPRVAPIFLGTGARAVAPEFVDERSGLAVVPVVIDLSGLNGRFLAFARRQQLAHSFQSFERHLHRAGETVVRQGEEAAAAFVIVEGEAEVAAGPNDHGLARLGRGEAFGEVALLTSRRHPADVVAATDLELMVLERHAFQVPPEHDSELVPRPGASSEQASVPEAAFMQPEAGVPPARGREWWRRPRVLVEGSDPVWRRFVRGLLGGDYELASCAGPESMWGGCPLARGGRCVLAERADVILNTFDLERAENRQVLSALRGRCPDTSVVALVPPDEALQRRECLQGHRIEVLPTSTSDLSRIVADTVARCPGACAGNGAPRGQPLAGTSPSGPLERTLDLVDFPTPAATPRPSTSLATPPVGNP